MRRAAILLVVVGCGQTSPPLPSERWFASAGAEAGSADSGTPPVVATPSTCAAPPTWANTGEPYLLTYCSGCHAEGVGTDFRYGAPADVVLDTIDDLQAHAERVAVRIEDGTMPPTGGPGAVENACFLAWLDQGAPGGGPALFTGPAGPVAAVAWEVQETLRSESDFPEGLTLTTKLVGLGRPVASGVWRTERWLVDGDDAWLVARSRFDDDGTVLETDTWDPPLRFVAGDTESWTVETVRTRVDRTTTRAIDETWDFFRDIRPGTDARSSDRAPVQVVGVEQSSLAELGLELSDSRGVVRRWAIDDTELGDPDLDRIDILAFESILPPVGAGLPMVDGMEWSARILGDVP